MQKTGDDTIEAVLSGVPWLVRPSPPGSDTGGAVLAIGQRLTQPPVAWGAMPDDRYGQVLIASENWTG